MSTTSSVIENEKINLLGANIKVLIGTLSNSKRHPRQVTGKGNRSSKSGNRFLLFRQVREQGVEEGVQPSDG
jgi:hypothetical protein